MALDVLLTGSFHLVLFSNVMLRHLLSLCHLFLWILILRGCVYQLLLVLMIILTSLLRVSLRWNLLDLDRLLLDRLLGLRFIWADIVDIFYIQIMLSRWFLDLNLNLFLFKIEITAIYACLGLLKLKQLLLNMTRLLLLLMLLLQMLLLLLLLLLWLIGRLLGWLVFFGGGCDEAWLGSCDYRQI